MQTPLARPWSTPCGFPPIFFHQCIHSKENGFPVAKFIAIVSWGIWVCENPQVHLKIFSKKSSSWYSSLTHSQLIISNSRPSKFPKLFGPVFTLLKHYIKHCSLPSTVYHWSHTKYFTHNTTVTMQIWFSLITPLFPEHIYPLFY